ncbi:MAG: cell surface protein SprA [candidate division Zixibacteria bacterium]|nr:cell surface protein SprA [candidate division Zixibacteria bacterium]
MNVKSTRLMAVVIQIIFILSGWNTTFSAVNDLESSFNYTSRIVAPLKLPEIPEGFSISKSEVHLFKFNNTKRRWSIEIPADNNYVSITLYAGTFKLYYPLAVSFENYTAYSYNKKFIDTWIYEMAHFAGTKGQGKKSEGFVIPIPVKLPEPVKKIIGEGGPRITVTGSRRIEFSGRSEWEDDVVNTGTFKQSKFPSLHMEQTSRFKIRGDIGSKIHIEVDQDSNRDVDLTNTLKLRYQGEEDEIIQTIEAGNTNLSLPNAQFIGYSENVQGLFGIKATAQLGNLELTMITSQEKGSNEKAQFEAGAQSSEKNIWDYEYLKNVYFDMGIPVGDSLINVMLFKRGQGPEGSGTACVQPRIDNNISDDQNKYYTIEEITSAEENRGEFERGYFQIIDETEYDVFYSIGAIRLHTPLDNTAPLLAASFRYIDSLGVIHHVGKTVGDSLVLKLIREPESTGPAFTTWDLEWKRVYSLGSRDLTSEGFELQIYKGDGQIEIDEFEQNGERYIHLFGFDEYNNSTGNPPPDGLFDFNQFNIDAYWGHLIFNNPLGSTYNRGWLPFADNTVLDDTVGLIYTESTNKSQYKEYYIHVKSSKLDNTFSLGRTNIIENSEVVKLSDGTKLKKGEDYNIIYEIGQITFISERAQNLASQISVDFEYSPFFMPESKSLFGMAAKYNINDKSSVSLAAMYRKESIRDYRPRVGREPTQALIWDSNFIFHFDPNFITSAIDALPLIETEAPSMIEFSGEVAQSFPNPNTKNEAYIDDFEGAKEYTDLIMRRGLWTKASPPIKWESKVWGDSSRQQYEVWSDSTRRLMYWYNPYDPYRINDIWPDREDFQEHENKHDVLVLDYFPNFLANDRYSEGAPDSSIGWAGIMRPMYAGLSNQSNTKFIEIWYKPDDNVSDNGNATLCIDAGKVTEDINDNGIYDTEDKLRNDVRNGVFEPDEDTGLDNLPDSLEQNEAHPDSLDPAGDNWNYDPQEDKNDYSRINGTENNRNDPDRLNRFDTEDINGNDYLDETNSYYQYKINLSNPEYIAETTSTGWKLLRIPFQDSSAFEVFGSPTFDNIGFIRVWVTGLNSHYTLSLASVQLVGNKWLELGESGSIKGEPKFEVTVKNSQEHANSYESPPGVTGEYRQDTGIQEKEQSLVLKFEDLRPGQSVGAYWSLLTTEDYTLYNKMKMFVHGDSNIADTIPLYFYFRVGSDSSKNFYEYKVRLRPGWDEDNYVEFDFAELTAFKNYVHEKSDTIANTDTTWQEKHYRVRGNPSLSRVKMFVVGVEYSKYYYIESDSGGIDSVEVFTGPVSGEAWCDELLLTDVRRESDFAGRASAKISFADLADITANYSYTGADFTRLSQKKPAGSQNTSKSVRGTVNVNKFFPPSWGLSLPATVSWQKTQDLPRFKSGSDIILPEELRDGEKNENTTWSFTTSQRFNRNTKNWLWNLTLNRMNTRYVYNKKYGFNPTTPVSRSTSYEASGAYDLSPKSKPFFKPFFWTKYLFLPKNLQETKLYFLPTVLKFDSNVKSVESYSTHRNSTTPTSSYVRDLTIKQTYGMKLFSAFQTDFAISSKRDISDPNTLKFSFNPDDLKLGIERNYSQNFSSSFSPVITNQLKPRLQYTANYTENSDVVQNADSTRFASVNSNIRGDLSLDLIQFLGIRKLLGSSAGGSGKNRNKFENNDKNQSDKNEEHIDSNKIDDNGDVDKSESEEEEVGEEEEDKEGFKMPNPLTALKKSLYIFNAIKPFQGSFAFDKKLSRSGLLDRPKWKFTMGLDDNPGVDSQGSNDNLSDQTITTEDYQLKSGVKPFRILDISASYKYRVSVNRASNTPTQTKSVDFPGINANISSIEKLPLLKLLVKSASIQSGYNKKIDETGNADTGELTERSSSQSYLPIIGLNLNLSKGIKATVRYDQNNSKRENLRLEGGSQRIDYSQDNTFKASLNYSLSAPKGLKIPLLGKVKFDSQLSFSVDFMKRYNKSWFFLEDAKNVEQNSVETSIEPRVSYRFSAKITGGLNARWVDSDDKIQQRKRHVREMGIWTELRF